MHDESTEEVSMHVHVGLPEFLMVLSSMVIAGFLWRTAAAHWADKPIGQAMAYIY
jgi:hypothetical protein